MATDSNRIERWSNIGYIAFGSLVSGGLGLALVISGELLGLIGIAGGVVGAADIACLIRGKSLWKRIQDFERKVSQR
jgi:uncharacterized protein GlcG (DUF336 family)